MCVIVGHKLTEGNKMNRAEIMSILEPFKGLNGYDNAYSELESTVDLIESEIYEVRSLVVDVVSDLEDISFIKDKADDMRIKLDNLSNNLD